jgi:uncharacterized membrane protein
MSGLDAHFLIAFLNRWIHVASMATVLGGSLLVWAVAWQYRSERDNPSAIDGLLLLSNQYEWFFWVGLGLLALTGVGNLGNFGAGLPGLSTVWGGRLLIKLILVLVLVLFSSIRTWMIAGLNGQAGTPNSSKAAGLVQKLYGGTILLVLLILLLALSLSHG